MRPEEVRAGTGWPRQLPHGGGPAGAADGWKVINNSIVITPVMTSLNSDCTGWVADG